MGIKYPREICDAEQAEGIAGIEHFMDFNDKGINTLCSSDMKPYGAIPNLEALNEAAGSNFPDFIPSIRYSIQYV